MRRSRRSAATFARRSPLKPCADLLPWSQASAGAQSCGHLRATYALCEPVAPAVQALAGAGAHEHALDARVHGVEVVREALEVEVDVLEQVELVDQHQLA